MRQAPPLHPIIDAWFCETLPLSPEIYEECSTHERRFHDTIVAIHQNLLSSNALPLCEALAAVARESGNPQLVVASLIQWAFASAQHKRREENAHLLHRIKIMLDDTFPEAFHMYILLAQYVCASYLGHPHAYQYLRRLLKNADPESMIWQNAAFNVLVEAAEQGRLCDRVRLHERFVSVYSEERFDLYPIVRFINALQNGDLATAIPQLPEIRRVFKARGLLSVFGVHRVAIELLMRHLPGVWATPALSYAEEAAECFQEEGIRLDSYMMTTRHLLEGRVQEALESARTYAANLGTHFFILQRFDGYDMVRAELAAGHIDGATSMLRKRFEHGSYGWLDNFFLARVAHLKGKTQIAELAYQRTLHMARHYEAENRLLFECSLACELPASTLMRWTTMVLKETLERPPRTDPVPAPPPTPRDGGAKSERPSGGGFIGLSPAANSIQERIRHYAKLDPPVLVVGETGTGKELVARQLHGSGPRRAYPFTAVNCAAMSPTLLQSELFGHVRGAFTGATRARAGLFETAANGTLLLDEIGDMTPEVQAAFLRVLETREYRPLGSDTAQPIRCRIITATNRDLWEQIHQGTFRQDLFYRVSGLTLRLPPLRERREDIVPLTIHFLQMFHPRPDSCGIAEDLQNAFLAHTWPGNVRELRAIVENLCLLFADLDVYAYKNLAAILPDWDEPSRAAFPDAPPVPMMLATLPEHPADAPLAPGMGDHSGSTGRDGLEISGVQGRMENGRGYVVPPRPQHRMSNLEKLEACFEHHQTLTRKDILIMLGISHTTASLLLRELMKQGVIRKVMPNKSPRTHYFEYAQAQLEGNPPDAKTW